MEPAGDPTASESYIALRNALLAMREDPSAVQSVLSAVSDSGASWVQTAYHELRRDLVQGRLKQAEVMGDLIGLILEFRDSASDDELSEGKLHREAMRALLDGIGAVLAQDNESGIASLAQLTDAVYSSESLRWVAYYWMAGAAADAGDFDRALSAISEAMSLAGKLDQQARGSSLCRFSEIEFQRGEYDEALSHLSQASSTFEEVGDRRGMAMASLALARMLTARDRKGEALEAAQKAQEADPDWDEPVVFLSQQALLAGDADRAAELVEPFRDLEPHSPEVDRQVRLVEAVQKDRVPVAVVVDYLGLRERPVTQETVEALEVLWNEHRDFLDLREFLAWSLVKVDRADDANDHFKEMAGLKLPSELQSSVLLGLGCLASRQHKHRQTGARLRAASSAYSREDDEGDAVDEFDSSCSTREAKDVDEALSESFDVDAVAADAVAQLGSLQIDEQEEEEKTPPPGVVPRAPAQPPPIPADAKRKPVEPKSVFTGDLQLFAVPDLLDFLNSSRRTGTLVITSENGIGAVHLKDGDIAGAASPNSTNVGDLLIEDGVVTGEDLDRAVQCQKKEHPDKLLGSVLLHMSLVDQQQLRKALEKQVRGALREMVGWTTGRFAFEPEREGEAGVAEIELQLDTRGVLLDALREYDEQNQ